MLRAADRLRTCVLVAAIVAVEVRTALRVHGARGAIARCLRRAGDVLALRRSHRSAESVPDAFDQDHGVHTRVAMDLPELLDVKRRGGEAHTPTPASVLRQALGALDIAWEDSVFVDFGSGAGRAVLLASEHPFKAIVGVEFSPSLHQRAEANVRRYRNPAQRCRDIRLHCGDAAQFTLPPDPLVIYFYNPFRADVMRRVLANIERSLAEHPRPVTVLHLWPRADTRAMFEASPALRRVPAGTDVEMFRGAAA